MSVNHPDVCSLDLKIIEIERALLGAGIVPPAIIARLEQLVLDNVLSENEGVVPALPVDHIPVEFIGKLRSEARTLWNQRCSEMNVFHGSVPRAQAQLWNKNLELQLATLNAIDVSLAQMGIVYIDEEETQETHLEPKRRK